MKSYWALAVNIRELYGLGGWPEREIFANHLLKTGTLLIQALLSQAFLAHRGHVSK